MRIIMSSEVDCAKIYGLDSKMRGFVKTMKKQVSMGMENDSPKLKQEKSNMSKKDEIYPFSHAVISSEDGTGNLVMNDVYASPRMLSDFENGESNMVRGSSLANYEKTEDGKGFYCKYCGGRIPKEDGKVLFCMYCGERISEDEGEKEREIITGPLYASPEFTMRKSLLSMIGDLLKRK